MRKNQDIKHLFGCHAQIGRKDGLLYIHPNLKAFRVPGGQSPFSPFFVVGEKDGELLLTHNMCFTTSKFPKKFAREIKVKK